MWALGASCGLAVMIGYLDFISSTLSLSRTFVFLPMFLVGFYLKKQHFDLLRAKRGRQIAAGVLGIVFLLCWCIDFDYSWLFGSEPYSTFGSVSLLSGLSRIGWYVLAFAATFSFWRSFRKSVISLRNGDENVLRVSAAWIHYKNAAADRA